MASAQVSKIWYVPDDFRTIQTAINFDEVCDGDQIVVSAGTYYETINYNGKNLHIMAVDDAVVIIDGGQSASVVTFANGEDSGAILQNFTITNGVSVEGGGIYCDNTSPTIMNNIIKNNVSYIFGGGIYCRNQSCPEIKNNTITENSADDGGGIYCYDSSPLIDGNTITINNADFGGGISCDDGSDPLIINNSIGVSSGTAAGNTAEYGGGIYCSESNPEIGERYKGNLIKYNVAIGAGQGGGIFLCSCGNSINDELIVNDNTIEGNVAYYRGGGIYIMNGSTRILFNDIFGNFTSGIAALDGGAGLYLEDVSSMAIKWNHINDNKDQLSGCGGGIHVYTSSPTVSSIEINSNSLQNNQINDAGAGIYYDTADFLLPSKLYNNLFVNNAALTSNARGGAGIFVVSGNPQVWNNTLDANAVPNVASGPRGGGIKCTVVANADIRNTIVYGNSSTGAMTADEIFVGSGSTTIVDHCCVRGGFLGGTNIITTQPVYTGIWYKLSAGVNSCVDSGHLSLYAPTDFENESRPKNGGLAIRCDVGWDER